MSVRVSHVFEKAESEVCINSWYNIFPVDSGHGLQMSYHMQHMCHPMLTPGVGLWYSF